MIIDVHIHPFCKEATVTPDLDEGFKRQFECKQREGRQDVIALSKDMFRTMSITDILAKMDESSIDKACLVAMDMTSQYGVVMVTNEDVSRLAAAHPDRFIPFASVDPNLGRVAVDQLEHAVKDLGCHGLKLCPPVQQFDFSSPRFHPLWEKALELDIVVWTHVSHQLAHPFSDARLGHPMLIEPVAIKYPDLRLVLGHCGFPWSWEVWSLAVRHTNVYVDISVYTKLYNHFPWDAYSKYGAESKVLFSTDYPGHTWKETLDALDSVDISPEFKKKILGHNAKRLLGL